MPGEPIGDEVKAQVIADLIAGVKPSVISECYNVSLPTISRYKRQIAPELLEKLELEKQQVIGDLVIGLLENSLAGAINITQMTNNKEWMMVQSADHLNKMYGTMVDKSVKITEVYEFVTNPDNDENQNQPVHIEDNIG